MKTTMVVVMALMMASFTMAMGGKVYTVGDSATWTNIGHVDYKTWASTKLFRVGDTIVFQYNKDFHNVARVSYNSFLTCHSSAPYATYTSGNDSFPIKFPGHYYFICTIPGHCQAGQKVDIRVPVAGGHSSLPPRSAVQPKSPPMQPLPFPYPQPHFPSQSPVNHPPSPLPSPVTSKPKVTPSSSPVTSHPQVAPSSAPTSAPIQPLPFPYPPPPVQSHSPVKPPSSQLPSPAPLLQPSSQLPSPAPLSPEVTPSSSPDTSSPAVAPAPHKSSASQLASKVKLWSTIMTVSFYLFGFCS